MASKITHVFVGKGFSPLPCGLLHWAVHDTAAGFSSVRHLDRCVGETEHQGGRCDVLYDLISEMTCHHRPNSVGDADKPWHRMGWDHMDVKSGSGVTGADLGDGFCKLVDSRPWLPQCMFVELN